jgi:hypothetical protein
MGKYARQTTKKKKQSRRSNRGVLIAVIVTIIVLIGLMIALIWALDWQSVPHLPDETQPTGYTDPISTHPTAPGQVQAPTVPSDAPIDNSFGINFSDGEYVTVSNGLQITMLGNYAGVYMEDGSEELVSGILSATVHNPTDRDLQLAQFTLTFQDFTARFEVTNLPAGSTAILLEKDRLTYSETPLLSVQLENSAFFAENMTLHQDTVEISGLPGTINVKNISETDIAGTIYIYYKHRAGDTYYGGITYVTKVQGGLKAGEIRQIIASHFVPNSCQVVAVTIGQ